MTAPRQTYPFSSWQKNYTSRIGWNRTKFRTTKRCWATAISPASWVALQQVELLNQGSCEAVPSELLPEPTWENRVTACEGEVTSGFSCDDMANMGCLETAPEAPLGGRMCHLCCDEVEADNRRRYREDVFTDSNYWHDEDLDEEAAVGREEHYQYLRDQQ